MTAVALLPDFVLKVLTRVYYPSPWHIVQLARSRPAAKGMHGSSGSGSGGIAGGGGNGAEDAPLLTKRNGSSRVYGLVRNGADAAGSPSGSDGAAAGVWRSGGGAGSTAAGGGAGSTAAGGRHRYGRRLSDDSSRDGLISS